MDKDPGNPHIQEHYFYKCITKHTCATMPHIVGQTYNVRR